MVVVVVAVRGRHVVLVLFSLSVLCLRSRVEVYIYIIYLYASADLPVKRYKKRGFRGLLLSCHRLTPFFRSVAFACSFLLEVSVVIFSSLVQSLVYTHILLSHNFRL